MSFGEARSGLYVSLVIPAYNEEARIEKSLDRILAFLMALPYASEVILVDDGSRDRTVEVARRVARGSDRLRILRSGKNLGKGGAIRSGMLSAEGEYVMFSDADLSVPIEALPAFLACLEDGSDVAIGTRQTAGALIEVHQPFYREFMGRIYTTLSNWLLGLQVSDFTCGFKAFRKEAGRDLFSRQRISGWSFDAELLYVARLKGYRVREIPVTWRNDRATKVKLWRDVIASFVGLLRIRLYDHRGRYL